MDRTVARRQRDAARSARRDRAPLQRTAINPSRQPFFCTSTRARNFTCALRSVSIDASPKSSRMPSLTRACASMMSMRSDFLGGLQNDEPLFNAHRQINVPPLREAELRKVVSRPAELLSARFETR